MCQDVWVNYGIIHFLLTATYSDLVHRSCRSLSSWWQENPLDRSQSITGHTHIIPSNTHTYSRVHLNHLCLLFFSWLRVCGNQDQLVRYKMNVFSTFVPSLIALIPSCFHVSLAKSGHKKKFLSDFNFSLTEHRGVPSWQHQHQIQPWCCCHPGALAWNATQSSGYHISLSPNSEVISGTWVHKRHRHECIAGSQKKKKNP